jgi:hypothetical protein
LPVEPWPPEEPNTSKPNKNNALPFAFAGYQHILKVEFQGNYYSTIAYLALLEKKSSRIYWDSMEYKVLNYPKANIVIKLHVISLRPN